MTKVRDVDARMTQDQGGSHIATFHPNGGSLHAQTDDDGNLHVFRRDESEQEKKDGEIGDGEPDLLPRDRKARDRGTPGRTITDSEQVNHQQRLRQANDRATKFWKAQQGG